MTEKIELELMSRRRAFRLLGLTVAFSVAAPATVLTVSDAEAQTAGMERREDRRDNRQGRREDRRDNRQDRRDVRRGVSDKPATTGSGTTTDTK